MFTAVWLSVLQELTRWALIFSFQFGFDLKIVLSICCTGLKPTYSSRQIKFKSKCSQYPNEKPISLNIWTGVLWLVNNPSVFSPSMAIRILISCWLLLTSIHLSDLPLGTHTQAQEICWGKDAHIQTHFFPFLVPMTPQISSGDREGDTKKTVGQMEWMRGGDIAGERRQDMAASRRGKGEHVKAEPTLESECDRQRRRRRRWVKRKGGGRGRAGVGEMRSWVKAPELPRFLCERHSAEKIDNVCPLCQGMPKTMTSSSSSSKLARTRGEREPQTHTWIFYSLLFTHLFIIFLALRLSLCTDADHEVFIFKNLQKIK